MTSRASERWTWAAVRAASPASFRSDILAEKFKAQGKPANIIEKIVESGLKTFYKEVCLLDQEYIREPDKNVAQFLKESEAKVGAGIKIAGYVRFELGEGIDKQESDFAAEVAAAAGRR